MAKNVLLTGGCGQFSTMNLDGMGWIFFWGGGGGGGGRAVERVFSSNTCNLM